MLGNTRHRLTRQVIEQTLRAHGWLLSPSAAAVGVSAYSLGRECRLYGFDAAVRKAELARERAAAKAAEAQSMRGGYAHMHRWVFHGRERLPVGLRRTWTCSECGSTCTVLQRKRA